MFSVLPKSNWSEWCQYADGLPLYFYTKNYRVTHHSSHTDGNTARPLTSNPVAQLGLPTRAQHGSGTGPLRCHCAAACMQNLYTVVMGGRRRLQQAREQIKILTNNISSIHTKEWQAIIWNADRSYNIYHYLTLPDLDDQKQRKVSFTFSFTRLVDVKILRYEPVVSIHLHCIRFTLFAITHAHNSSIRHNNLAYSQSTWMILKAIKPKYQL